LSQFDINFIHLINFSRAKQTSFFHHVQRDDIQNKDLSVGEVGAVMDLA